MLPAVDGAWRQSGYTSGQLRLFSWHRSGCILRTSTAGYIVSVSFFPASLLRRDRFGGLIVGQTTIHEFP